MPDLQLNPHRIVTPYSAATTNTVQEVARTTEAYKQMSQYWTLPLTLMGGTDAMRAAGRQYLPQNVKEKNEDYYNRLKRTVLFNAFRKTVIDLSTRPHSKPIVLENASSEVQEWATDIDRMGNNLNRFSFFSFMTAMIYGLNHILVDYEQTPGNLTLQQERDGKYRPYFTMISPDCLIGWRTAIVNGQERIIQARIKEEKMVPNGRYGERKVTQIRVLEPGVYEIWELQKNGKYVLVEDGMYSATDYVPLVTTYTRQEGFLMGLPPLMDLAHLNQNHWESSSAQSHILHYARMPILFGKNLLSGKPKTEGQDNAQTLAVNAMFTGPENSDLKYVEPTGAAINSGRMSLADLKEEMAVFGLDFLVRKPSVSSRETATGKSIDTQLAHSDLERMALNHQHALEQAFAMMKIFTGRDTDATVKLVTDFGISLNANQAELLLNARRAGEITRQTFLSELKRMNMLSDDVSVDDEITRLENEVPTLTGNPLEFDGNA